MDALQTVYSWLCAILKNSGSLVTWLLTDLDFGFVKIAPLWLLAFDGLFVYVVVAIAKWLLV